MRTDGQTDMAKLIVAFRDFAKQPKNQNHNFCFALLTEVKAQNRTEITVKYMPAQFRAALARLSSLSLQAIFLFGPVTAFADLHLFS